MATIQHYIQELLFERDCVVVPDFGGFITNFQNAKIDRSLNLIIPAKRWVAFNSLLKNDDGLLSHYISRKENISHEEANIRIKAFVDAVKFRLRSGEFVSFDQIGSFELNKENKLVFNPQNTQNYCADSFGLSPIVAYSHRDSQFDALASTSQPKNINFTVVDRAAQKVANTSKRTAIRLKKLVPFMTGVATAVLLGIGILSYEEQNNLSTLNPFIGMSSGKPEPALVYKTKPVLDTLVQTSPKKIQDSTIYQSDSVNQNTNQGDYFVIVGSFGSQKNAQKLVNELQAKGFENASIIEPEKKGRLIKVSANSFLHERDAFSESQTIKSKLNASAWIFKSSKK